MIYVASKKFVKNLSKLKKENPEYEIKVGKTLKNYADHAMCLYRLI